VSDATVVSVEDPGKVDNEEYTDEANHVPSMQVRSFNIIFLNHTGPSQVDKG